MTFASAIRFAAPLLLTATLAGCAIPYDYDPYYGGTNYSDPYYSGNVYVVDPYRPHRIHRRDRRDGDGKFRRHHRAPDRSGLDERHRRERAAADRATNRAGDRRRPEREAERAVAERWTPRAERKALEREPAPRRYDDYRGSGETDAAFGQRVERAEHEAERESRPIARILAGGALPEN